MDTRLFDIWNEPTRNNDCFFEPSKFRGRADEPFQADLHSFCISAELARQLHNSDLADELK